MKIGIAAFLFVASIGSVIVVVDAQERAGQAPANAAADPRAADRDAIRQAALAFDRAFESGDAKAVAAFWTDGGEYVEDGGETLRGRPAIEAAFAAYFKQHPKPRVDVRIDSIRFPSKDTAIEEGTLRTHSGDPAVGPSSTWYSTLHVREGTAWKIVTSREWGADRPKLLDLEWLIGDWAYRTKTRTATYRYQWNETQTRIVGRFAVEDDGKVVSTGTQTIGTDPATGRLRSWMFDDEGGHGESLWHRDGARWVLETVGTLPDGTRTAALNVISPLGPNEFQWRSTDRTIGGDRVSDTDPIKLQRVPTTR